MSTVQPSWQIIFAPGGEALLRARGIDPDRLYDDPRVRVWRDLPERQNCVIDLPATAASPVPLRLHLKRFKRPHGSEALVEQRAITLLLDAAIPTVPLIAAALHPDGRGYLLSRDLAGLIPADKALLAQPAASLCKDIAELAQKLHAAGLHHRDLYLCHFLVHPTPPHAPIHLIDAGRVARLPAAPLHLRWLVKDLAQLVYSVEDGNLPAAVAEQLLGHYLAPRRALSRTLLRAWVNLKAASIRRHDLRLRRKRPERRVSIETIDPPPAPRSDL